MTHIFLDFEMNPIPKKNTEARAIVHNEIIEIGAVRLDDNYEVVERYSRYVRPELNTVMLNITRLTGITNADVAGADLFVPAIQKFAEWIGDGRARIYAWGDSDRTQLVQECKLKGVDLPKPFRRWMDFQRVYTRLMGLSQRSRLSLANALGAVEQDFSGAKHRAADDAENSASLLALVKDPEAFRERSRAVMELISATPAPPTTLGELYAETFAKLRAQIS